MSKPENNFFNKDAAKNYDEKNKKLSEISDCLHFLTGLILREVPSQARVLCVGVGTGAEILSLAKDNPGWSFLGLDPSQDMLTVCQERVKNAGFDKRCEFIHGYIQDLPGSNDFDVALSFLVAHFVKREERLSFFQNMSRHLKAGGYLVNAEISFDLDSPEFPSMLRGWEQVQKKMGATPESLAMLPKLLRDPLTVLPPSETERLLKESGIQMPIRFFQALMIQGWYGKKP